MAGFVQGDLKILYRLAIPRFGRGSIIHAVCQCSCGNVKKILAWDLAEGQNHCGCKRQARINAANTKHGMTGTKIHNLWMAMLNRCYLPSIPSYKYYGGRGIKVCERWHDFANFYADMGDRPEGKSLDRIDVNGDYEPSNCRWATAIEQANNSRKNVFLEIAGSRMTVSQAARAYGMPASRLITRLRLGWDVERAVTEPPRGFHK